MGDMRKFVNWVRTKTVKLETQLKGEYLMTVPETADEFEATIGALR
jgi:hypothetical protein